MKILVPVLAAFIAVSGFTAMPAFTDSAEARSYKKKKAKAYRSYRGERRYRAPARRPYSIGYNGLCQRDTGTATEDLNFRNRCDVEEFWLRNQQQGGRR